MVLNSSNKTVQTPQTDNQNTHLKQTNASGIGTFLKLKTAQNACVRQVMKTARKESANFQYR